MIQPSWIEEIADTRAEPERDGEPRNGAPADTHASVRSRGRFTRIRFNAATRNAATEPASGHTRAPGVSFSPTVAPTVCRTPPRTSSQPKTRSTIFMAHYGPGLPRADVTDNEVLSGHEADLSHHPWPIGSERDEIEIAVQLLVERCESVSDRVRDCRIDLRGEPDDSPGTYDPDPESGSAAVCAVETPVHREWGFRFRQRRALCGAFPISAHIDGTRCCNEPNADDAKDRPGVQCRHVVVNYRPR